MQDAQASRLPSLFFVETRYQLVLPIPLCSQSLLEPLPTYFLYLLLALPVELAALHTFIYTAATMSGERREACT